MTHALKSPLAVSEARKLLGTTATEMSDDAIMKIVAQVDALTDIVITYIHDSKIQSSIDVLDNGIHNDS